MSWKLILVVPPLFTGGCLLIPTLGEFQIGVVLAFVVLLSVCASGVVTYFLRERLFLHGFLMGLFGALLGMIALVIESIFNPPVGMDEMAVPLVAISALPIAILVACLFSLGGITWRHFRRAPAEPKSPSLIEQTPLAL